MIEKQAASEGVKEVDEALEEEVKTVNVADIKVVEEVREESKGDAISLQEENKNDSDGKGDAPDAK